MKAISLVQALVLLHEKECLKKQGNCKSQEIEYFELSKKNVIKAEKLAAQIIGRDLRALPLQARILLLLIEQMIEKTPSRKKRSDHLFTLESIQQYTGWSKRLLKPQMSCLKAMKYLVFHSQKRLFSLRYQGRPIRTVKINQAMRVNDVNDETRE